MPQSGAITFECPLCGRTLSRGGERAGFLTECGCGNISEIPAVAPGAESPVTSAKADPADRPDNPYEVAPHSDAPAVNHALNEAWARVTVPAAGPAPRWSRVREASPRALGPPLGILAVSIICTYAALAVCRHPAYGPSRAGHYLVAELAVRVPILLLACLSTLRLFDIALGEPIAAVVKLCAIAAAPAGAVALLLALCSAAGHPLDAGAVDLFSGGFLGAIIAAAVSLVLYALLFHKLFDLAGDLDVWVFVVVLWLTQTFAGGLALHFVTDPPPRTAPYIHDPNGFHFTIGN